MKTIFSILIVIFLFYHSSAQEASWNIYNSSNSGITENWIRSIAIDDSGNKWLATNGGGLVKFTGSACEVYNVSNSEIPTNSPSEVKVENNIKWICGNGITKFDGGNWYTYTPSNSNLSDYVVTCLTVDQLGNKWIGTWWGGVCKFDDVNWVIFDENNSNLPSNHINCIEADDQGNIWVGTHGGGLAKMKDNNWTIYNTTNSGLPSNKILTIKYGSDGVIWIGTDNIGGLTKFNGYSWQIYGSMIVNSIDIDDEGSVWAACLGALVKLKDGNLTYYRTDNSAIPSDMINCIKQEDNNKLWIGTIDGLILYQKSNNILESSLTKHIKIYPNPTNKFINVTIQNHEIDNCNVELLNSAGEILMSERQPIGKDFEFRLDVSKYNSGIYYLKATMERVVITRKIIIN